MVLLILLRISLHHYNSVEEWRTKDGYCLQFCYRDFSQNIIPKRYGVQDVVSAEFAQWGASYEGDELTNLLKHQDNYIVIDELKKKKEDGGRGLRLHERIFLNIYERKRNILKKQRILLAYASKT